VLRAVSEAQQTVNTLQREDLETLLAARPIFTVEQRKQFDAMVHKALTKPSDE
jgi:hypothetical protein